jgi:hypothetical protein
VIAANRGLIERDLDQPRPIFNLRPHLFRHVSSSG